MSAVDPAAVRELLDEVRDTVEPGPIRRSLWIRRLAAGCADLLDDLDAAEQERDRLRALPAGLTAMAALYAGDREKAEDLLEQLGDTALEATVRAYRDVAALADYCLGRRHG